MKHALITVAVAAVALILGYGIGYSATPETPVEQTARKISQMPQYPEPKSEYGVFYGQRTSLFNLLPVDSCDIVMLGNSLTNGCEWHELLGMPNVKNRGINGDIVAGIADRVGPIIDGQPAKVFVLMGVNDISHHLTPEAIADQYAVLIDTLRAQMPDTRIYIQSCLPINIIFDKYKVMIGKDQDIRDLNGLLEVMAAEKGCTWVNLYPHFADEDGHLKKELTNDGLHLLGPGYLIWRDVLMPFINE